MSGKYKPNDLIVKLHEAEVTLSRGNLRGRADGAISITSEE